jgi:hypothetical protein
MPDPAFIIDGHMEQLILQRVCDGVPIQRLNCNSDDTEIAAIVKRISAISRILNNRFYPICVLIDREGRAESAAKIIADIEAGLTAEGLDPLQYRVGVCDRMIENWILADSDLIQTTFGVRLDRFEGENGKGLLRREVEKSQPYRETTIGVDLFCRCNVTLLYERSDSFRVFVDKIDFDCRWLTPLRDMRNFELESE